MFAMMYNFIFHFAAACKPGGSFLGFPTWYKYLDGETVTDKAGNVVVKCSPILYPPGHPDMIGQSIGRIALAVVEIMLRIAALVAIGFIIYGGYRFILSQGNSDEQTAARDTIINAVIGLIIAILATAIVTFVFRNIAQ